jgi:hypothetical protein
MFYNRKVYFSGLVGEIEAEKLFGVCGKGGVFCG